MADKVKTTYEKASDIIQRFKQLKSDRSNYEYIWDEITEYVLPSRGTFVYQTPGQNIDRKSKKRINSVATYAQRALTSRIIGEFTNPGSRWFDYRAPDPDIDKMYDVRKFLQALSEKAYNILTSTSFMLPHTEVTSDWCSYGTACMLAEDMGPKGYRWSSVSPTEIYVAENSDGEVDCVYREYELTYKQLCESFGMNVLSAEIHQECEDEPHKKFKIIHAVEPNVIYNPQKKASTYFKYASCYILEEDMTFLREGNFKHRPYIVSRFWKRTGEVYGGSPAIDALPDIRMVNVLTDTYIRGAQLSCAPPLGVAHDSVINPLKVTPYGINYGAISVDGKPLVQPLFQATINLRDLQETINKTEEAIKSAFFVDPLMNRENSIRTAAEVAKRSSEETSSLAPFLARYGTEYLNPVLDMILSYILEYENDMPIPKALNGLIPKIEFTGPLAKTQRGQELNNVLQFAQVVQMVGQVDPVMMQNINWNSWLMNVAELLGVPMDNINSPEYMAAMHAQAAKQQQQQQMMQMVAKGAQGIGQTMTDAAKAGLIGRQDLGLPPLNEGL